MKIIEVNHKKGFRPNIQLQVQRVEPSAWRDLGFHQHHYLTEDLNPSCKCLLFTWEGVPVAFVGIINQPMKGYRWSFRISRIVVAPDFQSMGLSSDILKFCGAIIKNYEETSQLYIKTVHKKMGGHLEKSPNWSATSYNGKFRSSVEDGNGKYRNRLHRASYCYRYDGDKVSGYEELLLPIKELRDRKKKNSSPTLF